MVVMVVLVVMVVMVVIMVLEVEFTLYSPILLAFVPLAKLACF
jgi:hypothetical protein